MIGRLFRREKEKGASLIEAALLLPMLILLAVGISEIGFLVIDYVTVTNSAREGARTGAAAADYNDTMLGVDADDLILESVEEAVCNLKFGTVQEVSIFKADSNGDPIVGSVNHYVPSLGGLQCDNSANGFVCDNGCPWAPASRDRTPPGFDVLGVEVIFSHSDVTGFFPFPTVTWSEYAVMQIEPDARGGS